jgi:penicillin-binding protein 2
MIKYILKSLLSFTLIVVIGIFLWISIFKIQVSNAYEENQLSNFVDQKSETLVAQRGNIYDRNGVLLAYNEPGYKVIFDNTNVSSKDGLDIVSKVADIVGINKEDLIESFKAKTIKGDKEIRFKDLLLVPSIERDQVLKISAKKDELPGIKVTTFFKRKYVYPYILSHVVGYTSESLPDVEVGKFGIERTYDQILSGTNGYIASSGQVVEPMNGEDIYISIDISLQQKLYSSLEAKLKKEGLGAGAAVISNVKNGEILAMVSYPGFDTNMFSSFLPKKEYEKLLSDPNLPLINKVVSLPQPIGSTFKPVVALALLDTKTIDTKTIVNSEGCMKLSDRGEIFCEAEESVLGNVDLYRAIAKSSNVFFCTNMLKMGIDKLNIYTDKLNLSSKSDIDLKEEIKSSVASRELKKKLENSAWYYGDSCNTAIGQGLNRITLIQLMNISSNVANEGITYTPHLGVRSSKTFTYVPSIFVDSKVDKSIYIDIKKGMRQAVTDGSAYKLNKLSPNFAAKTGSSEVGPTSAANSFSTGFWPYEAPEYSFAVFLRGGSWGFNSTEVIESTFKK